MDIEKVLKSKIFYVMIRDLYVDEHVSGLQSVEIFDFADTISRGYMLPCEGQ